MCTFPPEPRCKPRCSQGEQQNLLWITVGKCLFGGEGDRSSPYPPTTSSAERGLFLLVFSSQLRRLRPGKMGGFPKWVTAWAPGKVSRPLRACFPAAPGPHLPAGGLLPPA